MMLVNEIGIIASGIFGAIIGSFLNVVILRFNTGRSIASGRSYCFSCNSTLRWYELLPIVSYTIQAGKCRRCNSKISLQYVIVEILTLLLAISIYLSFGLSLQGIVAFIIGCLLLVIVVYDIRHTIIPDELVYMCIALVLAFNFINSGATLDSFKIWLSSSDFLIGPILFLFFASFWYFSKGLWMGLGDAKLALGLGWLLGASGGLSAIILSFWIGALWGTVALFMRKSSLTMKSEIPFAPFLILGTVIVVLTHWSVLSLVYAPY